jgi:CHAT domain-containing protein/tetratricopeptide (TPR) repeat protein
MVLGCIGFAASFILFAASPRCENKPLDQQILQLFRDGNYRDAAAFAEQAVTLAKSRSGDRHPDHIRALVQLGHVLIMDKRFADAQTPLKRALEIASQSLPADDLLLADALDALGSSYILDFYPMLTPKGFPEAEPLLKRALAIREKRIKANEAAFLDLIDRLASLYSGNQRNDECDRLIIRAVGMAQEQLGEDHPVVAALFWSLSDHSQYRLAETSPSAYAKDAEKGLFGNQDSFKKMLDGISDPNGQGFQDMMERSNQLMKQMEEGKKYQKPSIEILSAAIKAGRLDSTTRLTTRAFLGSLANLAFSHRMDKRYAEAEAIYKMIGDLRLQEVNAVYALGMRDSEEKSLTGLLDVYEEQQRTADIEAIGERLGAYQRAMSPIAGASGRRIRPVFPANKRLAEYFDRHKDFDRAERYWRKEIAELEAASDLYELANILDGVTGFFSRNDALDGVAGFYERHGKFAEAEATLQKAIDIRSKLKGEGARNIKETRKQLALFKERQANGGKTPPSFAPPEFRLPGFMEEEPGRVAPAECTDAPALIKRLEKDYNDMPPECSADDLMRLFMNMSPEQMVGLPDSFEAYAGRAQMSLMQGDWKSAVEALTRAAQIDFDNQQAGKRAGTFFAIDADMRPVVLPLMLIKAAARLAEAEPARKTDLLDTTFRAAQRSQLLAAATALGQMTARQANGTTRLAKLVRERDNLSTEWNRLDQQIREAVLKVAERPAGRTVADDRTRMDAIPVRIAAIDKTLAQEFPDYIALAKPQPLSVAEAQAYLGPKEALVLLAATPRLGRWGETDAPGMKTPDWMKNGDAPPETFIWVITKTDARWVKADLNDKNPAQEIFTLRCGLDSSYWDGNPALRRRCEALLRVPQPPGEQPPFHISAAYSLYRSLFGEVEDLIEDKELLIAPSGPFTALPFQVLVVAEPGPDVPKKAAPTDPAAYRNVAWLGTRQPITVLPAVSSLKALRDHSRPTAAKRPFIGFGNPLLTGRPDIRSHRERAALVKNGLSCGQLAPARGDKRLALSDFPVIGTLFRGRLADVAALREQLPLPETAGELCSVAARLGARDEDVRLGGRMTEADIKALSAKGELRNYRVLQFATHGLVASDTETFADGQVEPALMFTPPQTASETDDGLLTASEVTQLELDADWVIMSACSTAAGEGRDSEALSGLARAFFYAGARSLLVSHWAVDSDAAVSITTGAFDALAADPAIGKSEALRRSLIALQKKGGVNLHPAIWAPFSLVGGQAG